MNWFRGLFDERTGEQKALYKQAMKLFQIASKIVKNRDEYHALKKKINRLAVDNTYSLDSLLNAQEYNRNRGVLAITLFAVIFDFIISFEAIVAILDTIITEDLFGGITPYLPFVLTILFSISLVSCEIGISLLLEESSSSNYQRAQSSQYDSYPQWLRLYVIAPLSTFIDLMKVSIWKTLKQYGIILILPLMSLIAYLNMKSYTHVNQADVSLFLGKTLVVMVAAIVCHVNIIQKAQEIIRSWTYVRQIRPQLMNKKSLGGLLQSVGMLQQKEQLNQANFNLKEELSKSAGIFVQLYSNYVMKYRNELLNGDGLIDMDRDYLSVVPEWVLVYIRNLLGRIVLSSSEPTVATNLHKGIITGENIPTVEGIPNMPQEDAPEMAFADDTGNPGAPPFF